jgi:hypothetical protein
LRLQLEGFCAIATAWQRAQVPTLPQHSSAHSGAAQHPYGQQVRALRVEALKLQRHSDQAQRRALCMQLGLWPVSKAACSAVPTATACGWGGGWCWRRACFGAAASREGFRKVPAPASETGCGSRQTLDAPAACTSHKSDHPRPHTHAHTHEHPWPRTHTQPAAISTAQAALRCPARGCAPMIHAVMLLHSQRCTQG